ncbi:MAG: hypothetical protein SFU86_12430, partial [Pirellulaceae bacterium]|nr:hypothetical protein [Pirellulaceae bacterium]
MKTSVQLLTGALALSLAPLMCQGATPQASAWAVAAASASQAGSAADNRRQADDLLRQARKAIKEQRLDDADALIAQAEGLNVKYDPLTARFIDTPPSMRALLTSERSKASGPQLPSSRFPALLAGPAPKPQPQPTTTPPQDPFNLGAQRNVVEQIAGDEKSRAAVLLKDARAALAAGDKFAALAAWQKAAALPAQYGPNEDSPQRVAADLQAAGIDPSRLQPASASPTSPYMLRPTDIPQAADKLPNLGGPSSPPAAALPQGSVNPYNLPAENNPLAEGLRGGGAFQPVAPAGGPPPAGTSQFQPPPGGSPYVAAPGGPALPGADEPRRLANFDPAKKAEAGRMIAQARIALDKGDLQAAQQLAEQAQNLNIPDEAYAAQETRPWQLLLDVNRAMYRREGIAPASGTLPAAGSPAEPRYPVAQGLYDPTADKSQNVPASSQAGIAGTLPPSGNGPGYKLFDEGLKALENQDREGALAKFAEAWKFQDQLDPLVRQQLKDKLTFLRAAAAAQPLPAAVGQPASPLAQATSQQQILLQKLDREIVNEERLAEKMAENDPLGALDKMQKLRERVAGAEIDPVGKKQLLSRVDP